MALVSSVVFSTPERYLPLLSIKLLNIVWNESQDVGFPLCTTGGVAGGDVAVAPLSSKAFG